MAPVYLCIVLIEEVVLKHRLGQKMQIVKDLLKLADPKAAKVDTVKGASPLYGQMPGYAPAKPASEEARVISLGF